RPSRRVRRVGDGAVDVTPRADRRLAARPHAPIRLRPPDEREPRRARLQPPPPVGRNGAATRIPPEGTRPLPRRPRTPTHRPPSPARRSRARARVHAEPRNRRQARSRAVAPRNHHPRGTPAASSSVGTPVASSRGGQCTLVAGPRKQRPPMLIVIVVSVG